jgi:hypothetical protein
VQRARQRDATRVEACGGSGDQELLEQPGDARVHVVVAAVRHHDVESVLEAEHHALRVERRRDRVEIARDGQDGHARVHGFPEVFRERRPRPLCALLQLPAHGVTAEERAVRRGLDQVRIHLRHCFAAEDAQEHAERWPRWAAVGGERAADRAEVARGRLMDQVRQPLDRP